MMAHQFFRPVHRATVEKYGARWTEPENIVTSGPFMLKEWRPYDRLVVVRNPDVLGRRRRPAREIRFYPISEVRRR